MNEYIAIGLVAFWIGGAIGLFAGGLLASGKVADAHGVAARKAADAAWFEHRASRAEAFIDAVMGDQRQDQ